MSGERIHRFTFAFGSDAAADADTGHDPLTIGAMELEHLLNQHQESRRYRVERLLGRGGSGQIMAVLDTVLQRRVAVKCVAMEDDQARADLERERKALTAFAHANIVPLLDAGAAESGVAWLMTPLAAGHSLAQWLASDPERLGDLHARCMRMIPVAEALAYAHATGWVHGDVAPGNILLADDGSVTLVDWGSASPLAAPDRGGRVTPAYAAPERLRGAPPGVAADVFGLGACLAHLLTGHAPRQGSRLRPPSPHGWRRHFFWSDDAAVTAIAGRCLAEAPSDRYPSCQALAQDLRAVLRQEASSVYKPPWPLAAWRACRRRPGMTAGALMLVALLIVGSWLGLRYWHMTSRTWTTVVAEDFTQPLDPVQWLCRVYPAWHQQRELLLPVSGSRAPWYTLNSQLRSRWSERWFGAITLHWRMSVGRDLRVSYVIRSKTVPRNFNCYLGPDRFRGWGIHIGAFDDPRLVALSDGRLEASAIVATALLPEALQPERDYRVSVSLVEDRLRVLLDERPVIDYQDPLYFADRPTLAWGLETAQSMPAIDSVQVERLQRPQVISALELPARLMAAGAHAEAAAELRRLSESTQDQDQRAWLLIQQGRCMAALDQQSAAQRHWWTVLKERSIDPSWRAVAGILLVPQANAQEREIVLTVLEQLPLAPSLRLIAWRQMVNAWDAPIWQGDRQTTIAALAARLEAVRSIAQRLHLDSRQLNAHQLPNAIEQWYHQARNYLLVEELAKAFLDIHPSLKTNDNHHFTRLDPSIQPVGALPHPLTHEHTLGAATATVRTGTALPSDPLHQARAWLADFEELFASDPTDAAVANMLERLLAIPISGQLPLHRQASMSIIMLGGLERQAEITTSLRHLLDDPAATAEEAQALEFVQALQRGEPPEQTAMPSWAKPWAQALAAESRGDIPQALQAYARCLELGFPRNQQALIAWRLRAAARQGE